MQDTTKLPSFIRLGTIGSPEWDGRCSRRISTLPFVETQDTSEE